MAVAGAVAVAAALIWALASGDGGPEPGDGEEGPADAGAVDVAALDEEFRPLHAAASGNLREEASSGADEGAADAVVRTLADLNQSWVEGDLRRHLSHYADRVDFYAASGASRARIERERRAALERYPEREIRLERQAVTFPEPGVARAVVDKSWTFDGPEGGRSGSGRQEYVLESRNGGWRVVSERLLDEGGG